MGPPNHTGGTLVKGVLGFSYRGHLLLLQNALICTHNNLKSAYGKRAQWVLKLGTSPKLATASFWLPFDTRSWGLPSKKIHRGYVMLCCVWNSLLSEVQMVSSSFPIKTSPKSKAPKDTFGPLKQITFQLIQRVHTLVKQVVVGFILQGIPKSK